MPSDRTDFLKSYYAVLNEDIRRNDLIVPKVCAIESGFVVLFEVARWRHEAAYLPPILVLITSAWAMHMLINANLWARRSLLMAANVELEFFEDGDLDRLLPKSYYLETRNYRYRRIFRIGLSLSAAFFILGATATLTFSILASVATGVLIVGLLWSLYLENARCAREYVHLVDHAPGRKPHCGDFGSGAKD